MIEDTLIEILIHADVNEYGRLAQTNHQLYDILNDLSFWRKKYASIGMNEAIFQRYFIDNDLEYNVMDYKSLIKQIKRANIILWIIKVEATSKEYNHLFLQYKLEYKLTYPFILPNNQTITIKKQ